jgi:antitoxin (DNA-binding transcriptional repressor) of toxin-antitoxin stability system
VKKTPISVTDAARNFADCVNRVHYQNVTFVLLKNGVPVARLVPERKRASSVRKLAAALRKFDLSPEEARAWNRDLRAARQILKPPVDKWR